MRTVLLALLITFTTMSCTKDELATPKEVSVVHSVINESIENIPVTDSLSRSINKYREWVFVDMYILLKEFGREDELGKYAYYTNEYCDELYYQLKNNGVDDIGYDYEWLVYTGGFKALFIGTDGTEEDYKNLWIILFDNTKNVRKDLDYSFKSHKSFYKKHQAYIDYTINNM